jgi:diguanylate cyclase (GGDEF)-like protein
LQASRTTMPNVQAWPVQEQRRSLAVFIAAVVLADAVAFAVSAITFPLPAHALMIFCLLLGCNAATVELARRATEPEGLIKDFHAVWELPVAILAGPACAIIMPAVRLALAQARVRRAPDGQRVFCAAAAGLGYGSAAVVFRAIARPGQGHDIGAWLAAVAACAILQWAVRQGLILAAVKLSEPQTRARGLLFGGESLQNDMTELCVAVLATLAIAISALSVVLVLPLVTLLQRSCRHARLVRDSRADSKTGLLNAATWESESAAEVVRSVRTKSPLAVALLDIDRFKVINDTYGHLVGDQVIKEIARTLTSMVREYDLAGRFGGEEFSLLLPQTRAVDAFRIAERVRANIAGLSIIAPGATGGQRVHVTVSIGVAALDSGSERKLAELMAAADAALYRAKSGGRDQVQMISTSRGLSAISSSTRGINGAAAGHHQDLPLAFRRAEAPAEAASGPAASLRRMLVPELTPLVDAGRGDADGQDREDRGAAAVALRRVACTQHLGGVVALTGPAVHLDRRAAAVPRDLPVPDLGRVLVLDPHRRAAVHGALGHLDDDRHVRGGMSGPAGSPSTRCRRRGPRAAGKQHRTARHQQDAGAQTSAGAQARAGYGKHRPPYAIPLHDANPTALPACIFMR